MDFELVLDYLLRLCWLIFQFLVTHVTITFQLGYKFHLTRDQRTAIQTVCVVTFAASWWVTLFVFFWLPLLDLEL